ncbi:MAG: TIGR03943 family protein [Actinomycetota bacterium]
MTRSGRAAVILFVGVVTARLVLSGGFGWFVQQHMRYPLAAAAVALLVFGAYELIGASRGTADDDHDPHDQGHDHVDGHHHDHDHGWAGPRVGWLLALPLLVLVTVAPTGLGAEAAARVDAYVPTETDNRFGPLPDSDGPLEMKVLDFLDRAAWDPEESLNGRTIRLEGLVVNDPEITDGFKLTRFMVSCCAADGIPLQVTVRGDGPALENDTWVIADVVWTPPEVPYAEQEGPFAVEADLLRVEVVPGGAPQDPYESPY